MTATRFFRFYSYGTAWECWVICIWYGSKQVTNDMGGRKIGQHHIRYSGRFAGSAGHFAMIPPLHTYSMAVLLPRIAWCLLHGEGEGVLLSSALYDGIKRHTFCDFMNDRHPQLG